MSLLVLRGLRKRYGESDALHPIDLDVGQGEFITVLGPSGCGKSTLLRLLCGIVAADAGEIHLAGRRVDHLPPERRDVAMVFQSYALFPHMSVLNNLRFGLRMKGVGAAEQARRIDDAVQVCQLDGLLDRLPRQLSGGQQQRVALARALVMRPALMLFDEPLSNLDAALRTELRAHLLRLHRDAGTTSLYVTHDQADTMAMADRAVLMRAGRVVEVGTPVDLFRRPRTAFAASFFAQGNVLCLAAGTEGARLPWGQAADDEAPGTWVAVRPEDIALAAAPQGAGVIDEVSFAGAAFDYAVRVGDLVVRTRTDASGAPWPRGTRVDLCARGWHALQEGGL